MKDNTNNVNLYTALSYEDINEFGEETTSHIEVTGDICVIVRDKDHMIYGFFEFNRMYVDSDIRIMYTGKSKKDRGDIIMVAHDNDWRHILYRWKEKKNV